MWSENGIFVHFRPGLASSFGALSVGWLVVVVRGLYLARHLFILSLHWVLIQTKQRFSQTCLPLSFMQDPRKKCDKPWFLCDSRNQDLRVFDIQQQSFWRLYNYFVRKMLFIRPWSMVIVVTLLQIVVILEKHFSNISLVLWISILVHLLGSVLGSGPLSRVSNTLLSCVFEGKGSPVHERVWVALANLILKISFLKTLLFQKRRCLILTTQL